ncbi:hypothetical protein CK203_065248 [Vitis vinifera]|uniref:Uncharacterized protein n=1 Tax=Vitis vinifera TaxID=29760 RepID=A0A438CQ43_VITVI|nr:hypothetical protein CK203_116043 [Vitis vinifera]RVW67895.1 hypothetical protein CK203_065248 [Vitis vinifera]
MQESSRRKSSRRRDKDPFCVIHKVPSGDTPYVRAKHAQVCSHFFSILPFEFDCDAFDIVEGTKSHGAKGMEERVFDS